MFRAALLTTFQKAEKPRCPSKDEWINKMWYNYAMEYYFGIKGSTDTCYNMDKS